MHELYISLRSPALRGSARHNFDAKTRLDRLVKEARGLQDLHGMHASNQRSGVSQVSPSDAELRARIQEQMHRHGEVDASKIGVVVRGGQVLLWGSVASEHERTLAGEIAGRLTARTSVINHIQVFRTTHS